MKRLGTKAPLDRPFRVARRHEASDEEFERLSGDAKHPSQHFSDEARPPRRAVRRGHEFRRHDVAGKQRVVAEEGRVQEFSVSRQGDAKAKRDRTRQGAERRLYEFSASRQGAERRIQELSSLRRPRRDAPSQRILAQKAFGIHGKSVAIGQRLLKFVDAAGLRLARPQYPARLCASCGHGAVFFQGARQAAEAGKVGSVQGARQERVDQGPGQSFPDIFAADEAMREHRQLIEQLARLRDFAVLPPAAPVEARPRDEATTSKRRRAFSSSASASVAARGMRSRNPAAVSNPRSACGGSQRSLRSTHATRARARQGRPAVSRWPRQFRGWFSYKKTTPENKASEGEAREPRNGIRHIHQGLQHSVDKARLALSVGGRASARSAPQTARDTQERQNNTRQR